MDAETAAGMLSLTVEIVSAHLSRNRISPDAVPALIQDVYRALAGLGRAVAAADVRQPAVSVRKSVFPDYIVCLDDGKKLKMLKRHLKTAFGLTPEQYRARWGLAPDYPMVAPSYARHRSALAKQIGLGTRARGRA